MQDDLKPLLAKHFDCTENIYYTTIVYWIWYVMGYNMYTLCQSLLQFFINLKQAVFFKFPTIDIS